jgi:hypothetical protein
MKKGEWRTGRFFKRAGLSGPSIQAATGAALKPLHILA